MARSMASNKLVCVLVMCMVLGAPLAHAAVSCAQVFTDLSSCISYAKGGGALTASCCNGVRALNSAAKTTPDRQQSCGCIKSLAGSVPGINYGVVAGIPAKCDERSRRLHLLPPSIVGQS
ncbi:unnamed protein product [Dovyalis caffra]|uniref:Non-specific lipid-transfer protein n=1 Tax=Dovyalis caffra TaxID=77055 RepID=A0AAV1S2E3_9ROSI|nr:unnamed protein product [Dovyalis caffra]